MMAVRRRTNQASISHAKNNVKASRSFAFVIKASSSVLASFSTYLWMDKTLLPMMRRDAAQMVS